MSSGPKFTPIDNKLMQEYPDVWDDERQLGTYVRLLRAAHDAWPEHTYWEGHADPTVMAQLVNAGLVIAEGKRFTVKGIDKRRQERQKIARKGAEAMHAKRTASSMLQAEPPDSIKQPSSRTMRDAYTDTDVDTDAERDTDDPLAALYDVKAGQVYEDNVAFVNEMAAEYGDELVARCIRESAARDGVKGKFLTRVKGLVVIEAERQAKAAEAARKKAAAEEAKRERERIANATPEERARAEETKAMVDAIVKGMVA